MHDGVLEEGATMTTLWKRITENVDAGLAATLGAIKVASEKAAETSHSAQQKYQRGALEARIMREFGELGSRIYEKALRQDVKNPMQDPEVQSQVEKIKALDQELAMIEARMEKEAREK
jgi:hypothetical protein